MKWQHILQYKCIGVYSVADGCTVAEFFETTYLCVYHRVGRLYM